MVTPNAEFGNLVHCNASFLSELCLGAVLVETSHGEELLVRNAWRTLHRDQAIRVTWVTDDDDAHTWLCVIINRLTLANKYLTIDTEQVSTLHPLLAWHGTNEQCPIDVLKANTQVRSLDDFSEQWKSAVIQLHSDSLKGAHTRLDFN